jgi:hypothetical protein
VDAAVATAGIRAVSCRAYAMAHAPDRSREALFTRFVGLLPDQALVVTHGPGAVLVQRASMRLAAPAWEHMSDLTMLPPPLKAFCSWAEWTEMMIAARKALGAELGFVFYGHRNAWVASETLMTCTSQSLPNARHHRKRS